MIKRIGTIIGALFLVFIGGAASCNGTANSVADCAFVVGNGQSGNDANLHNVAWPGQNVNYDSSSETVTYVPCNARNYIINNGQQKNANNQVIGDRGTPTTAYLSDGTPVLVSTTAYWTLDQDKNALKKFYAFCLKYNCASSQPDSGTSNFASSGWNGMLGENFSPTIDSLVRSRVSQPDITNAVWKTHDQTQAQNIAQYLSDNFDSAIQKRTGYDTNLFCGSGNSGWKDPNNPGQGQFTCSQVRFVVDDIELAPPSANSAVNQTSQNQTRAQNAQALYGSQASYWLGLQDTVAKCAELKVTCNLYLGNPNNP